MFEYNFNMALTLALALVLLLLGRWIKSKVAFFQKYFIPAPVIGGLLFSIFLLVGNSTNTFSFTFDANLKTLLMLVFFTTVGFAASFRTLAKGGVQVVTFLIGASILIIFQNIVGVSIASLFGLNPLIGLAAGSVPLSGGHGTSGAFGPILEAAGATGATTVAIASATFGLVAGCMIGGPVARRLMLKNKLKSSEAGKVEFAMEAKKDKGLKELSEENTFRALVFMILSVGLGGIIIELLGKIGITLPNFTGPVIVAALLRNIMDKMNKEMPTEEIFIIGNIALSLFLSMSLMSMKLWELASLAVPLVVILLTQTLLVAIFVYFVTFRIMGRDYDAAVMCAGHCGFGLGATPNAMANMEAFTSVNGASVRAFFVVPMVGALFIDFTNAILITTFIELIKKFLL
jgi:ESS family glutamate:Na+ symporter